jgi:hypothetical protein
LSILNLANSSSSSSIASIATNNTLDAWFGSCFEALWTNSFDSDSDSAPRAWRREDAAEGATN